MLSTAAHSFLQSPRQNYWLSPTCANHEREKIIYEIKETEETTRDNVAIQQQLDEIPGKRLNIGEGSSTTR